MNCLVKYLRYHPSGFYSPRAALAIQIKHFLLIILLFLSGNENSFAGPDLVIPLYELELTEKMEEARREHDTASLAVGLEELAGWYLGKGNTALAVEYFNDASEYYSQLKIFQGVGRCQQGLGKSYEKSGEYRKALKANGKAEKLFTNLQDSASLADVLCDRGQLYLQMGKIDQAFKAFSHAHTLAEDIHAGQILRKALEGLSAVENKRGDYLSSLVYYKEGKILEDSLKKTEPSLPITLESNQGSGASDRLIELEREYQSQKYQMARHRMLISGLAGGIVLILLAGICLFTIYRYRIRRDTTILTLQNLRQQMNPHFLFNVMNSVYLHVMEGKNKESADYLMKLTRLMRRILENSREDMVSLVKEIELLNLFVELEQQRLQKFSYTLDLDPTLEPEHLLIPSMILQPFVENAVIHGLNHLDGLGHLKVSLRKNNRMLHCEIVDNGIGREKSGIINTYSRKKHHSLGTGITENRLRLLNSLHHHQIHYEVTDLKDPQGKSAGTLVKIDLPFEIHQPVEANTKPALI